MHELGLIIEVVEHVERVAEEQNANGVGTVELCVGESFNVIPVLMKKVFKKASEGTRLDGAELNIIVVPASAECGICGAVFNPLKTMGVCTQCGADTYKVLSGKEFEISSITIKQ